MWNEFESKEFMFEERMAVIVYPKVKPIGRILFKTEYLNAFPGFDIAMLERGSNTIQTQFKIPASAADVLIGIILFFMLGCEFFINYRLTFHSFHLLYDIILH